MSDLNNKKIYGKGKMMGVDENTRGKAVVIEGENPRGKVEIFDEEELSDVTGGATFGRDVVRVACSHCGRFFPVKLSHSRVKCPYCKEINTFEG